MASRKRGRWIWIAVVLLVLYYPVGALITENIDDDPQFAPRNVAAGESRAVAVAADLVDAPVDFHRVVVRIADIGGRDMDGRH